MLHQRDLPTVRAAGRRHGVFRAAQNSGPCGGPVPARLYNGAKCQSSSCRSLARAESAFLGACTSLGISLVETKKETRNSIKTINHLPCAVYMAETRKREDTDVARRQHSARGIARYVKRPPLKDTRRSYLTGEAYYILRP